MGFSWQPLFLTLKLATITTLILLLLGIPLAWLLASWRGRSALLLQTLVSMPLVLPPTVLGFYLLLAFNPQGLPGRLLQNWLGIKLVFTFEGLVVASILYSLPFMVNPVQAGFAGLPRSLKEAGLTLGKSQSSIFFRVLLPNIRASVLTGTVLTFAHTVGEFGVILMIGGSIPGETMVASIALYNEVEALNYGSAHQYALVLFCLSFVILFGVYLYNRNNLRAL